MSYTKKTVITWNFPGMIGTVSAIPAINDKLQEMIADGKTNGIQYATVPSVGIRHWIDLKAAEEWIDFISDIYYNGEIISISIEDI